MEGENPNVFFLTLPEKRKWFL